MDDYRNTKEYKDTIKRLIITEYFRGALDAIGWSDTITALSVTKEDTFYHCSIRLSVWFPTIEKINALNDALHNIFKKTIKDVCIHPHPVDQLCVCFEITDKDFFKNIFARDTDTLRFTHVNFNEE